jgi:hypothetical protein
MLANRGNARHAFNGPDDVNAGQHRPHASPHVFHYLETTFSGRRPKLHNVHSLNPKTQQRQPVVESRIGQKMSAPRYGPTPTPKQAPYSPEALRIESHDDHPSLRDQNTFDLAQDLMGIR